MSVVLLNSCELVLAGSCTEIVTCKSLITTFLPYPHQTGFKYCFFQVPVTVSIKLYALSPIGHFYRSNNLNI